jgi:hypothetical protein
MVSSLLFWGLEVLRRITAAEKLYTIKMESYSQKAQHIWPG